MRTEDGICETLYSTTWLRGSGDGRHETKGANKQRGKTWGGKKARKSVSQGLSGITPRRGIEKSQIAEIKKEGDRRKGMFGGFAAPPPFRVTTRSEGQSTEKTSQ